MLSGMAGPVYRLEGGEGGVECLTGERAAGDSSKPDGREGSECVRALDLPLVAT